jgi:6-phosphogluconolactonase
VHRIRGELAPGAAADELASALEGAELDFLLLGLGPDGHMASLFPGSPQLDVTDRLATHGPAGLEPWVERVTFTLPTIQAARRIVFIVSGGSKADAVARAFGGDVTHDVPASLSRLASVPVEVFLDEAAAARMQGG